MNTTSSLARLPLGEALKQNLLLSPEAQSYYDALSRGTSWTEFLLKKNLDGTPSRAIWVDLRSYLQWARAKGKQLGSERKQRILQVIRDLEEEEGQS